MLENDYVGVSLIQYQLAQPSFVFFLLPTPLPQPVPVRGSTITCSAGVEGVEGFNSWERLAVDEMRCI
jgi:hypothetical protein